MMGCVGRRWQAPRVAPGRNGLASSSRSYAVEDRETSEYGRAASQANERSRASGGGVFASQIG
jgi:hypothetical protein